MTEFEKAVLDNQHKEMVMLQMLMITSGKGVVTVNDIARIEDVAVSTLRAGGINRYLLPRFGESAYPTGKIRWTLTEYLAWYNKDPQEKKALYEDTLRSKVKSFPQNTVRRAGNAK